MNSVKASNSEADYRKITELVSSSIGWIILIGTEGRTGPYGARVDYKRKYEYRADRQSAERRLP